jgi:hypothetical protein
MVCSTNNLGRITVVHGINMIDVPDDGLSVAELRFAYRNVLNVSPEARAYVGGDLIADDWVPEPMTRVAFVRDRGRKGAVESRHETTPRDISPAIARFCAELAPGQAPVFVRVEPTADAAYGYCVFNVPPHVDRCGGRMVLGWCIWEWPGILLNAEFHACWLSPEGELIDITPKPDGEKTILFLPDPALKFEGERILGRIESLSHKREVLDYVAVSRKLMRLKAQGGSMSTTDFLNIMGEAKATREKLIRRIGRKESK